MNNNLQNEIKNIIKHLNSFTKANCQELVYFYQALDAKYKQNIVIVMEYAKKCLEFNFNFEALKATEPLINAIEVTNIYYNELMTKIYDRNLDFYNAKYFLLRLLNLEPKNTHYLTLLSIYNSFLSFFNPTTSFMFKIDNIINNLSNQIQNLQDQIASKNITAPFNIEVPVSLNTIPNTNFFLVVTKENKIALKIIFSFELGACIMLSYLATQISLKLPGISVILEANAFDIPAFKDASFSNKVLNQLAIKIIKEDFTNGHSIIIEHNLNNSLEISYLQAIGLYLKLAGNFKEITLKKLKTLPINIQYTFKEFLDYALRKDNGVSSESKTKDIQSTILDTKWASRHIFSTYIQAFKDTDQYYYFDFLYKNGLSVLKLDFKTSEPLKTFNSFLKAANTEFKDVFLILNIDTKTQDHLKVQILLFDPRYEALSFINNVYCATNDEIQMLSVNTYQNTQNTQIIYSKDSEFKDLSILFDYPLPDICNDNTIQIFKSLSVQKQQYLIKSKYPQKLINYYTEYRNLQIDKWIEQNYLKPKEPVN